MQNHIEREIRFLIKVKNQYQKGVDSFRGEISKINKEMSSLNSLASSEGFGKSIDIAAKNVASFAKALNKAVNKRDIQKFKDVAYSIEGISKGAKFSLRSLRNLSTLFNRVAEAGERISSSRGNFLAGSSALGVIAKHIKTLASTNLDNLSELSGLFRNFSNALGKLSYGGIDHVLKQIGETEPQLKKTVVALNEIISALRKRPVSLSNAVNKVVTGVGGGGVTGGGVLATQSGSAASYGGNVYAGVMKTLPYDVVSNFKRSVDKYMSTIGEESPNISPEEAVKKIIESIQQGNLHFSDFLMRWAESKSVQAKQFVGKVQKEGMNLLSASQGASSLSGKIFAETQKGEKTLISAFRGTAIHTGMQHVVEKFIKEENNFGEWIYNREYKKKEYIDKITIQARELRAAVEKELSSAFNVRSGEGKLGQQIFNAAKQVEEEFLRLAGKKGVFSKLRERLIKTIGDDAASFKNISVEMEKALAPIKVISPGFKKPKNISKEVFGLWMEGFAALKKNLGENNVEFNNLMKMIKNRGLTIYGTADMIVTLNKQLAQIIDFKTGKAAGNPAYLAAQLIGGYKPMVRQEYGVPYKNIETMAALGSTGEMKNAVYLPGMFGKFEKEKETLDTAKERVKVEKENTREIERQSSTLSEVVKKTEIIKEQVLTTTSGGAGGAGGGGKGGGGIPPIGIFGNQYIDRIRMLQGSMQEQIVVASNYVQILTKIAIKQQATGEAIDLTRAKLDQYKIVVENIADALSKYVMMNDKTDMKHLQFIANIEKLTEEANKYSAGIEKAAKSEQKMALVLEEIRRLRNTSKYPTPESIKNVPEFIKDTERSMSVLGERSLGEDSKKIQKKLELYKELKTEVDMQKQAYQAFSNELVSAIKNGETENEILNSIVSTLKKLDPEFEKFSGTINSVSDAVVLLNRALANQHREELVAGVEIDKVKDKITAFRDRLEAAGITTKGYSMTASELALGIHFLSESETYLKNIQEKTFKAMTLNTQKQASLTKEEKADIEITKKLIKEKEQLMEVFDLVSKEIRNNETALNELRVIEKQSSGKTTEEFRGMLRTTIKGFAGMLRSQAAWIAGYGLMFGVLGGLKNALGSVINIEHQFARAMRVSRSEMKSNLEIAETYRSKGVSAMIAFGKSSEDVGEILYQLGSAGLSSEESLAALNSTMKMIIGTEGDVQESTKMVAAIYNNFKDSIYGASKLSEKFAYINNIVVRTFREHQVELNELREGYKHLMATGKIANLTFIQMSAILGVLNDHLIKSGIAGRSVQTVISRISRQPYEFAEAFNVGIDPRQPLNFIKLLRQIAAQYDAQKMTAADVGKIFERLGLRGAKSFAALISHIKDLDEALEDLKENSTDAADLMARVMLEKPDVAIAKMRESLAALVRVIAGPTVKAIQYMAYGISKTGSAISGWNESLLSILGTIIRWTSVIATFKTLSAITAILNKRFAKTASDGQTLITVGGRIQGYFKNVGVAFLNLITLGNKSGSVLATLGANFKALGKAIFGSTVAFSAFLGLLAIVVGVKLYDWLVTTNKEYADMAKKLTGLNEKGKEEISQLQDKISKYDELAEKGNKYAESLAKIAREELAHERRAEIQRLAKEVPANIRGFSTMAQRTGSTATTLQNLTTLSPEALNQQLFLGNKEQAMREIKNYIEKYKAKLEEQYGVLLKQKKALLDSQKTMEEYAKAEKDGSTTKIKLLKLIGDVNKALKEYDALLTKVGDKLKDVSGTEVKAFESVLSKVSDQSYKVRGKWEEYMAPKLEMERMGSYERAVEKYKLAKEELHKLAEISAKADLQEANITKDNAEYTEKLNTLIKKRIQLIKDSYAAVQKGDLSVTLMSKEKKIVENLISALFSEMNALKATEDRAKSFAKTFNDLNVTLNRTAEVSGRVISSLGEFSGVFYANEDIAKKIEGIQKQIDAKILRFEKAGPKMKELFLKYAGFAPGTSKEELRAGLESKRDIVRQKLIDSARLKSLIANKKYTLDVVRQVEDYNSKIDSLNYSMNKYNNVEMILTETKRKNSIEIRNYNRQIEDQKLLLFSLNSELQNHTNMSAEQEIMLQKLISKTTLRISALEKERDKTKEVNDINNEWLNIANKIKDLQNEINALQQTYTNLMGVGASQSYDILLKLYDAKVSLENKTFEDSIEMYKKLGFSAKEIEEMHTAMLERQYEDRLNLEVEYHNAILSAHQKMLETRAQLDLDYANGFKGNLNGMIEAMKAGFHRVYIDNENIAMHISEMTGKTFYTVTDTMSNMLTTFVEDSADGMNTYKEMMHKTLSDIGHMLINYAMKLLVVYMIQKLIGLIPTGGSGGFSPDIGITRPGFEAVPSFGAGEASGGPIYGGIPGKDSVPILAMQGEYMIPKDSVDYYGIDLMNRLRKKEIKRMQSGGIVENSSLIKQNTGTTKTEESGSRINYITIKTNDVNSFRQAIYENRDLIDNMVIEDLVQRGFIKQ